MSPHARRSELIFSGAHAPARCETGIARRGAEAFAKNADRDVKLDDVERHLDVDGTSHGLALVFDVARRQLQHVMVGPFGNVDAAFVDEYRWGKCLNDNGGRRKIR